MYFDFVTNKDVSKFIPPEDLIVPYEASDMSSAERITHAISMSLNEVKKQQITGFYANVEIPEKKQKTKKTKTDPNLFLFSDVLEEATEKTKLIKDSDEISEVSDISEFSDENETIEDIDTPSYLRKGSNQ